MDKRLITEAGNWFDDEDIAVSEFDVGDVVSVNSEEYAGKGTIVDVDVDAETYSVEDPNSGEVFVVAFSDVESGDSVGGDEDFDDEDEIEEGCSKTKKVIKEGAGNFRPSQFGELYDMVYVDAPYEENEEEGYNQQAYEDLVDALETDVQDFNNSFDGYIGYVKDVGDGSRLAVYVTKDGFDIDDIRTGDDIDEYTLSSEDRKIIKKNLFNKLKEIYGDSVMVRAGAWTSGRYNIEEGVILEGSENVAVDEIVKGYITAMLWASTDDDGEPLDSNYDNSDIDAETLAQITKDCESFISKAGDLFGGDVDMSTVGHDFFLTRHHHGSGFWDGDYENGEELTEIAQSFKESSPYVGDDGKIYVEGGESTLPDEFDEDDEETYVENKYKVAEGMETEILGDSCVNLAESYLISQEEWLDS